MQKPALVDPYNRTITYLRLSVTDRCDMRCIYCMPENGMASLREHSEQLTVEEMLTLVKCMVELGINKVRVTGGEPLIYRGIQSLLMGLSSIGDLKELVLTTNGTHLEEHIPLLQAAGIKRVNVSLDTLDPERYRLMTRGGDLLRVLSGIQAAKSVGLTPIRINSVIFNDLNENDLEGLIMWAQQESFELRLIEWMSLINQPMQHLVGLTYNQLCTKLINRGFVQEVQDEEHHDAATYFIHPITKQRIGCIGGEGKHFCHACNRLRLTSDGYLKWCLFSSEGLDLKGLLRSGTSLERIKEEIILHLVNKPESGAQMTDFRTMSQIGG